MGNAVTIYVWNGTLIGSVVNIETMTKKKTSLNIDQDIWEKWVKYVVNKTGSTMKISEETERIIKKEMDENPL